MSLTINQTQSKPVLKPYNETSLNQTSTVKERKSISTKTVVSALALVGATTLAILALKNKKKIPKEDIKAIIGKDPKVEQLTDAEKNKLIKELQAKTDSQAVKDEIRRLVENGEWDKL